MTGEHGQDSFHTGQNPALSPLAEVFEITCRQHAVWLVTYPEEWEGSARQYVIDEIILQFLVAVYEVDEIAHG